MNWMKCAWKGIKATLIATPCTIIANPEQVATDIAVSLAVGAVNSVFNWWKHK